jgi:hypothetical protein
MTLGLELPKLGWIDMSILILLAIVGLHVNLIIHKVSMTHGAHMPIYYFIRMPLTHGPLTLGGGFHNSLSSDKLEHILYMNN